MLNQSHTDFIASSLLCWEAARRIAEVDAISGAALARMMAGEPTLDYDDLEAGLDYQTELVRLRLDHAGERDPEKQERIIEHIEWLRERDDEIKRFSHAWGPSFDPNLWHEANDDPHHDSIVELGLTAHEYLWVFVPEWLRPLEGFDEWSRDLHAAILEWDSHVEVDRIVTTLRRELRSWIEGEYARNSERQAILNAASRKAGIDPDFRFGPSVESEAVDGESVDIPRDDLPLAIAKQFCDCDAIPGLMGEILEYVVDGDGEGDYEHVLTKICGDSESAFKSRQQGLNQKRERGGIKVAKNGKSLFLRPLSEGG